MIVTVKKRNNFTYFTDCEVIFKQSCIICYNRESNVQVACCSQYYCTKCIDSWCKINHSCPHCRSSQLNYTETLFKYSNYKIYGKKSHKEPYILIRLDESSLKLKVFGISYANFTVTKQILLRKINGDFSLEPVNSLNFISLFTLTCFNSKGAIHYAISYLSF